MESKRKIKQNLMESKLNNKKEELNKVNNSNKVASTPKVNDIKNKVIGKNEENENKVNTIYNHIIIKAQDKFLFLYTYLSKFSDKNILVLFSTKEEVQVSLILFY